MAKGGKPQEQESESSESESVQEIMPMPEDPEFGLDVDSNFTELVADIEDVIKEGEEEAVEKGKDPKEIQDIKARNQAWSQALPFLQSCRTLHRDFEKEMAAIRYRYERKVEPVIHQLNDCLGKPKSNLDFWANVLNTSGLILSEEEYKIFKQCKSLKVEVHEEEADHVKRLISSVSSIEGNSSSSLAPPPPMKIILQMQDNPYCHAGTMSLTTEPFRIEKPLKCKGAAHPEYLLNRLFCPSTEKEGALESANVLNEAYRTSAALYMRMLKEEDRLGDAEQQAEGESVDSKEEEHEAKPKKRVKQTEKPVEKPECKQQ